MKTKKTKVLVFGASGMLGSSVLRLLIDTPEFETYGTVRSKRTAKLLPESVQTHLIVGIDIEKMEDIVYTFNQFCPDVVINCIGLIKQHDESNNPSAAIFLNSLLPHYLAKQCSVSGSRLIHISTDCVFSGLKGMYSERDLPDARDLYGLTKLLGEVDYPHSITLRTSLIGHELKDAKSLVGWFLEQKGVVKGYRNAIFSGLPTVEVASIIRDIVIPQTDLSGIYHLSAEPINKFDLLTLIARVYKKEIKIIPHEDLVINRSLDSSKFRVATGFSPKPWTELIQAMHDFS